MLGAIAAGAALAGVVGGMMNKSQNKMSPYLERAMREINSINVPDPESLKIKLDQLVQQGVITPEMAQASLVDNNAYDDVQVNTQARGAQMSALEELQNQISNGGLTAVDQSRIQHTLDDVNNTERGQQQSIMEDAHRRGVSGSGLELANRLMSQQHAADTAGRQGMDIAAMAQQAKMDALKSAASLGGQIESQDYSEQAQKAAAQNTINQFNATNQQEVTLSNIAARNSAQQANLQEKQRVSDANTTMTNANRERDASVAQQTFDNRMTKANATGALLGQQGNAAQHASDVNTSNKQNIFSGLTSAGTILGVAATGQKPTTTDPKKSPYMMSDGGRVPGQAPFPGDDPRNDVIDAKLSPGEVVIPRSEAQPSEYDAFMSEMPRSAEMPSADAVRVVLEALSGMGC